MKNMATELGIILIGYFTLVPAIQVSRAALGWQDRAWGTAGRHGQQHHRLRELPGVKEPWGDQVQQFPSTAPCPHSHTAVNPSRHRDSTAALGSSNA